MSTGDLQELSHIKIVSGGTVDDTHVYFEGKRLPGITRIELVPITCETRDLKAIITFEFVALDITATATVGEQE